MPFLREKSGRWSPEKIVVFVGGCIPIFWLIYRAWTGDLSAARPINDAIHATGNYAIWLIVLSLAITPARRLFNAPKLINMRRTLGVTAFCYVILHLTLYVVQEKYDFLKVASEIVLRIYLTIGFVALIGLTALATTSTDGMIKRLGGARWNRLHKPIYPIAILGSIHFMMQTKLDITKSVMVGGFLIWLLGYRLWHRYVGAVGYVRTDRSHDRRVCPHRLRRSRMVRHNDRRHVDARAGRKSRLGHLEPDVPPRAMGTDCRPHHHARIVPVVAEASGRKGAQDLLARTLRRHPGPVWQLMPHPLNCRLV